MIMDLKKILNLPHTHISFKSYAMQHDVYNLFF